MATASPSYRMRLKHLTIKDFRGIEHLDLDFTAPDGGALDMAILAGANGCGKTSVLEGILEIADDSQRAARIPDESDVRFGSDGFVLAGVLDVKPTDDSPGERLTIESRWMSQLSTTIRKDQSPKDTARLLVEYYSAQRVLLLNRQLLQVAQAQNNVGQLEAMRLPELQNRLVSSFYRELREVSRQSAPTPVGPPPFRRMQQWWNRFNPDTELDVIPRSNDPGSGDEVVVRDAGKPIPADVTSLTMACGLMTSRQDIPSIVSLDRMSSGQLAMLAFAGPIIFRDRPADIVLIDEPEQHLHVMWQRELLPALRALSPSTQFIVATHSREILDSALSYERFILVEDDDPRSQLEAVSSSPE